MTIINYNRVSNNDEDNNNSSRKNNNNNDEDNLNEITSLQAPLTPKDVEEDAIIGGINVIILDSAQTKFAVKADSNWTVEQFKRAGCTVHKILPEAQRLIYMGRLLQDPQTLKDCGIDESDKIIHLFPKPQVVISNNNAAANTGEGEDQSPSEGAHVPQIIVDADEAERRSQILILSSHEIFEAQHRVKLLSFLLLVVCSMRLLTLFTLMVGVDSSSNSSSGGSGCSHNYFGCKGMDDDVPPGDPTDTSYNSGVNSNGVGSPVPETWQNIDFVDFFISGLGFYVATLGIKATTENTVALAKRYFFLLLLVGSGWLSFNTQQTLLEKESENENNEEDISDFELYSQAFWSMFLPILVWALCFLRAFQFSRLMQEAQREADERAILEDTNVTSDEEMAIDNNHDPATTNTNNPNSNHHDLHDQTLIDSRTIT